MISTESLVSVPEIHERLGIREELSADVSKIMSEEAASPVVRNAVPEEEEQQTAILRNSLFLNLKEH